MVVNRIPTYTYGGSSKSLVLVLLFFIFFFVFLIYFHRGKGVEMARDTRAALNNTNYDTSM